MKDNRKIDLGKCVKARSAYTQLVMHSNILKCARRKKISGYNNGGKKKDGCCLSRWTKIHEECVKRA